MKIKHIHKIVFFIILILFTTKGLTHAELTTSQIAKKYSSSVVTIIALDENDQPLSLGSGFIINEKGDIATNHHVLEGSTKAIIKTTKGDKGAILNVISYDPELDLLIAKTSLKNIKPLPFGDSDTITVGEDIVAIGNPAGLEGTVSKGIISGIRKIEDYKFIQITAPISPGSSGGPVFNLAGKVIGIATAYLDYGQSLNFAMPINYLRNLKVSNLSLASLPKKSKSKYLKKDDSLVQIFDVHQNLDLAGVNLFGLDFAIKNISNYPISNILLFFVYINYKGEVVSYSSEKLKKTILPQLALQFHHKHYVKYLQKFIAGTNNLEGKIEIRILDYEIDRASESSPTDLFFK